MEGKFEGNFEDGTYPWVWTGTSKIFEQYLRNGCKPVKYGQCWVFAAVATTMCRALGIPARPVTNFVSARDTNHTLSVDKYFDVFGEEIKGGPDGDCYDSIWNFHTWTETWMARPDLPHGYGGWQAIDPTPQDYNPGNFSSDVRLGFSSDEYLFSWKIRSPDHPAQLQPQPEQEPRLLLGQDAVRPDVGGSRSSRWSRIRLRHALRLLGSQRRCLPLPGGWNFPLGLQEDQGQQLLVRNSFVSFICIDLITVRWIAVSAVKSWRNAQERMTTSVMLTLKMSLVCTKIPKVFLVIRSNRVIHSFDYSRILVNKYLLGKLHVSRQPQNLLRRKKLI